MLTSRSFAQDSPRIRIRSFATYWLTYYLLKVTISSPVNSLMSQGMIVRGVRKRSIAARFVSAGSTDDLMGSEAV